ncbi:hypothetical protein MMC07_007609 [Pseudocyphellaria aurata]|nr:hypothetical protein [Pseudocyphellaria aurata]
MTAILGTTLYYLTYPLLELFSLLLTVAAPVMHLTHYVVYGLWWWPLSVLAKFETLYIFFGVATLVGVLAGTGLHFVSGSLIAALSLERSQTSSSALSSSEQQQQQQQQQQQRRPQTLAESREERRSGKGWSEMRRGRPNRSGKGAKEEENRDDEKVWQDRIEGAYRRAEGIREERATVAAAMAKSKKKDGYGDWSGRREREGEMGRNGVLASTILEESSSGVGF